MTGLELRQRDAALGAAVLLGEEMVGAFIGALHLEQTLGQLERGLDRIVEPSAVLGAHHQPVDDDRYVVVHAPIELGRIGDFDEVAVDDRPHEPLFARGVKELTELTLPTAHQRREDLDPGSFRPLEDRIGDLARALTLDRTATVGTMGGAGAGVQEAKVVVDLGDRSDCRARIVTGAFLLDGDGRRQAFDGIDVGLLHQAEELAGVRRQGLDVAALALGVDSVEGERRLSGARQPGDDRQPVPRDGDVDVSKVVLAGAANDQGFLGHSLVNSPVAAPDSSRPHTAN